MAGEQKMQKCRFCGKDSKAGEPCEHCGFDLEESRKQVRLGKIREELRKEIDEEEKKAQKKQGWG